MTTFNFENFYFEHIDIENYDTIMQELRPYVLVKLNQMDANYYSGLLRLPEKELLDNCPAISNWFAKNNMELIMSAIHIMQGRKTGQLHSDSNEDATNRLALNLDIENADITKTKLYKISVPGTMHYTTGQSLPYIVYQNNKETCEKVAEYDLLMAAAEAATSIEGEAAEIVTALGSNTPSCNAFFHATAPPFKIFFSQLLSK